MYDTNNVFAKIIRGEIPCNKVYENEHAISFNDVNPIAQIHVLVIPKGGYTNIFEFINSASPDEQNAFWECVNTTVQKLNCDTGCNIFANVGRGTYFYQSVPHFHIHIVAGEKLKDFADIAE